MNENPARTTKTYKNRVDETIRDMFIDDENIETDNLVIYAYYMGRETEAKEIGDIARTLFQEQKKRALGARYHRLALSIQGNIDYIYDPDYAQDVIDNFGSNITLDGRTYEQRVNDALKCMELGEGKDTLDDFLAFAYWYGMESHARDFGEKIRNILHDQIKRSEECVYQKMAKYVQGNIRYIYDPHYSMDMTNAFGYEETAQ